MEPNQAQEQPPLLPGQGNKTPPVSPLPLSRSKAWTFAAINVFAFPGLGTIMARKPGGYVQAGLSVVGFVLVAGFLVWFCYCLASHLVQGTDPRVFSHAWRRYAWAGLWGTVLCFCAWSWALLSSVQLVRETR